MPNGESFLDRSALYCDGSVGVDLYDGEGAALDQMKFRSAVVYLDEDLLSDGEVVGSALGVCTDKALIDLGLA